MKSVAERIETKRLILRRFNEGDVTDVAKLCNNVNIFKTTLTLPYPYSEENARFWIGTHQKRWEQGIGYEFAIIDKTEDRLIGAIGLFVNSTHKVAETAYWLGEEFWNRGYTTEAAKAVLQIGFDDLELHKIYARHFDVNQASGKIMLKIGMKYEGTLREHIQKESVHHDLLYYGILKSEYQQSC